MCVAWRVATAEGYSPGTRPAPAEIADIKRRLRLAMGGILPMENLAKKLDELYSRALKDALGP